MRMHFLLADDVTVFSIAFGHLVAVRRLAFHYSESFEGLFQTFI
jgi:hypothetical protein